MSIFLMTGLPGGGKSLYVVSRYILGFLRSRRHCYHCVDGLEEGKHLIPSFLMDVDPDAPGRYLHGIPEDRIPDFYSYIDEQGRERGEEFSKGAYIVIDESQRFFPASEFNSETNKSLSKYLSEHRHSFHDVMFVTQHQDLVFVGIRRMAELSYICVNNKHFFSSKSSRVYTYNRDAIGPKLETGVGVYTYDPACFKFYSSYKPAKSRGFKEDKARIRWWLHPKMVLVYVFFLFVALFWLYNFASGAGSKSFLFRGIYGKPAPAASNKVALPAKPPEPLYSELYHSGDTAFYLCAGGRVDTSFSARPWEACR